MKKLIILFVYLFTISSYCQETTTYYLIRHAEKDKNESTNPNLTIEGVNRAKKWSSIFENIKFDAVYSTYLNRTNQTAIPTAKANNIEVIFYNPEDLYNESFKLKTDGKTILIVGHLNTTPELVNQIINQNNKASREE